MSGTIGATRDANYYSGFDDNFDQRLNSQSADYVKNFDSLHAAEMNEDRWKAGGGIQVGASDKVGAGGLLDGGKTRDDDGTIDRVRDPPPELFPLLYRLKCHVRGYHITLEEAFSDAGGTTFGTIPTTKFGSCLVNTFNRAGLTEDEIMSLINHYGIGQREPDHHAKAKVMPYECCAWMDLCEDIGKAIDPFADEPGGRLPAKASVLYPKGVRY